MVAGTTVQDNFPEGVRINDLRSPLQPVVNHYAALMRGGMTMLELKDLPETKLFADIMALGDDYENEVSAPEHEAQRTKNFVNMIVKQVRTQEEIFNRPVTQKFSYTNEQGKLESIEVPLLNPDTQQPLLFGDILKGRSGPEHNMLGRYQRIDHLLEELSPEQKDTIEAHKTRAKDNALKNNPELAEKFNLEELTEAAASVLHSKNGALRIFSDYDICIGEQDLYNRALAEACKKQLGIELPPELQSEVGQNALLYGGEINQTILEKAQQPEKPISYTKAFQEYLKEHPDRYFHSLNFEKTELYTKIGLAFRCDDAEFVVYKDAQGNCDLRLSTDVYDEYATLRDTANRSEEQNAELARLDKALRKLKETEGKNEYYDIVLSDQSIAPDSLMSRQTAHNRAIQSLLEVEGVSEELIQQVRLETVAKSLETEKIIIALSAAPGISNDALQHVAETLEQDMKSALSTMHAEDTAKKLAQTTTQILEGNQSKAVGNEHDAARYLARINELRKAGDREAEALQQMTAVMFVTSGLGWDLNAETLAQMQKRNVETFSGKLDGKVYHSSVRDDLHDVSAANKEGNVGPHAQESFDCYERGFSKIAEIASTKNAAALQQNFEQMQQSYEPLLQATQERERFEERLDEAPSPEQIKQYEKLVIAHQRANESYNRAFSNMKKSFQHFIETDAPAFKAKLEREGQENGILNPVEDYATKLATQSEYQLLFNRRRKTVEQQQSQMQEHEGPDSPAPPQPPFYDGPGTTPTLDVNFAYTTKAPQQALPLRSNSGREVQPEVMEKITTIGAQVSGLTQRGFHSHRSSPTFRATTQTVPLTTEKTDDVGIQYDGDLVTLTGARESGGTQLSSQEPYHGR